MADAFGHRLVVEAFADSAITACRFGRCPLRAVARGRYHRSAYYTLRARLRTCRAYRPPFCRTVQRQKSIFGHARRLQKRRRSAPCDGDRLRLRLCQYEAYIPNGISRRFRKTDVGFSRDTFGGHAFRSVQSPKILAEKIDEINALKPDAVILGGDIVDESATLEDVYECFEIFGRLESRCGTFYVYGNHDRQEYSVESERAYTERELADAIGSFGITVLRDEEVALSEEVTLVGREDRSSEESDRLTSAELLKDADRSKFIIVADHQPVETAENAAQGADLQVSGHTHAGQIFPLGVLIELSGRLNYGEYKVDGMTAIVSSGTAGWGFPIRTQEHCEYVLIDIVPAR